MGAFGEILQMEPQSDLPADFSRVQPWIARGLAAEGFAVHRGDSQEWAAAYSLTRANLDGCVAVFLRPHRSGETDEILYKLLSERILEGSFPVVSSAPREVADAFVLHLERVLTELLQPGRPVDPGVGRGLRAVSAANAELNSIRHQDDAEESAR